MAKNPTYEQLQQRISYLEKEVLRLQGMEKTLQVSEKEAHAASMELSIGLSEVFETLRHIAAGNPYVRIAEESPLELVRKLKHHVNLTAQDLSEIVALSHEFAIGLAEHSDVLHRVSSGELDARVSGSSSVELLEALKQITNQMIQSVSDNFEIRKKSEASVAKERERLFALLESLPVYVYLQAPDHTIRFANRRFKEHFGAPNERHCYEVIGGKDSPCDTCKPLEVLRTGKPVEWEWERKNGKTYQVFDYPFIDTDGTRLVLELGIDITKRKKAQQEKREMEALFHQAQKMEALGILAGSIIHDFNNLLMVIQSDASMLLREIDSDHPHYERLKSIKQEVHNGTLLLDQMLGFARGGATLATPTNVNDVIRHTCDMFGRSKPDIHISRALEQNLWLTEVNTTQIDQVFLNLFLNAADAMPEGGKLDIRTENTSLNEKEVMHYHCKPGAYVKSSVKDHGIGMDEKIKQRIFEPFFTTKGKGKGTGLGLASVYGIVKDHGGFVTVQSEKGKGSTFQVYLPAVA